MAPKTLKSIRLFDVCNWIIDHALHIHIRSRVGHLKNKKTKTTDGHTEMINSIETTIAIAFFSSIAIAIGKAIFLLVGKLLLLLTGFSNYCYCYWFY